MGGGAGAGAGRVDFLGFFLKPPVVERKGGGCGVLEICGSGGARGIPFKGASELCGIAAGDDERSGSAVCSLLFLFLEGFDMLSLGCLAVDLFLGAGSSGSASLVLLLLRGAFFVEADFAAAGFPTRSLLNAIVSGSPGGDELMSNC